MSNDPNKAGDFPIEEEPWEEPEYEPEELPSEYDVPELPSEYEERPLFERDDC